MSRAQPLVVFGGFLSFPSTHAEMRAVLSRLSGQPVWVVRAYTHHWLTTVAPAGWALLLQKLDAAMREAVRASPTGKVTLLGYSSGGVIARLYLGPAPFEGRVFNGLERVDTLITLGSPHYNHRGGYLRDRVEQLYPGAYFAPRVHYVSVAGKAVPGRPSGTAGERWAFRADERLGGPKVRRGATAWCRSNRRCSPGRTT